MLVTLGFLLTGLFLLGKGWSDHANTLNPYFHSDGGASEFAWGLLLTIIGMVIFFGWVIKKRMFFRGKTPDHEAARRGHARIAGLIENIKECDFKKRPVQERINRTGVGDALIQINERLFNHEGRDGFDPSWDKHKIHFTWADYRNVGWNDEEQWQAILERHWPRIYQDVEFTSAPSESFSMISPEEENNE
jgi:hypothetical protein